MLLKFQCYIFTDQLYFSYCLVYIARVIYSWWILYKAKKISTRCCWHSRFTSVQPVWPPQTWQTTFPIYFAGHPYSKRILWSGRKTRSWPHICKFDIRCWQVRCCFACIRR